MSVPYSKDLRTKTVNLLEEQKMSQVQVAKLLAIDKSTIYRWYKRYKTEGSHDIRKYHDNKDKIKIDSSILKIDSSILESIVEENPSLTLCEIALKITNVTDVAVLKRLRKLGYSFKKNSGYTKKEMNV